MKKQLKTQFKKTKIKVNLLLRDAGRKGSRLWVLCSTNCTLHNKILTEMDGSCESLFSQLIMLCQRRWNYRDWVSALAYPIFPHGSGVAMAWRDARHYCSSPGFWQKPKAEK